MAVLDITFSELKEKINQDISLEELEDVLFNFGLEIDSYNLESDDLKIDITADRPDMLSLEGFSRAIKSYLGLELAKEYKIRKSNYKVIVDESVKNIRPFTVCAVIKNLDLNDSKIKQLIWAQEKLHLTLARKRKVGAIGIYPLNKISFPIYFKASKGEDLKFIPLGETKVMTGLEILRNHPTGIEYSSLLNGFDKYPYFIDSNNEILSMPPIINSQKTGQVEVSTKEVFIECSGFNLEKLKQILNIIVTMFSDFGGEIYSVEVEYGSEKLITPNLNYSKKIVSLDYLNKVLGTNIDLDNTCKLLNKMLYICKKKGKDLEVLVPAFRSDVLHDVDIADDLARAYGFSNIELRLPQISTIGELLDSSVLQDNIINTMAQLGYQEVRPLSLSSKVEQFDNFNISGENYLELGYSKDKTLDVIINWLTPKLLKILKNNQHMVYPQKIFSCDYVVVADDKTDVKSRTIMHLAAMIANPKINFTKIASSLYSLCNLFGWDLKLEQKQYDFYIKGRSAQIVINNKSVGHIGELSVNVLRKNNYFIPVSNFEINIDLLENK